MGESKFPTAFKLTVRVRDLFPKISWSSQLWYLTSNGICFKPRISASWPSLLNWSNCMKGICFEPIITALVFLYECLSLIEVNAKERIRFKPMVISGRPWLHYESWKGTVSSQSCKNSIFHGRPFRLRIMDKYLLQDVTESFLYSMVNRWIGFSRCVFGWLRLTA